MKTDREFSEQREYFSGLRFIKVEILKVLDENNETEIHRAAKTYPQMINHLLMKRNIKSATVLFPFFDLPLLQKRKQEIDLIDLNTSMTEIGLLETTVRRIDREFELE